MAIIACFTCFLLSKYSPNPKELVKMFSSRVEKSVLHVIRADYEILTSEIENLKHDVDILNSDGLVLKDSVISNEINSWLSTHPEATTTVQDGSITESQLSVALKEKYIPRQYDTVAPGIQDLFLEKVNDTSLLLEPTNLQTIRDSRLKGFVFRTGERNHAYIERCYFYGADPTPVFDFDSDNWVGSIKVIGCESYFRPYFITADSKDMTDIYFHLCTIEGAKKFATLRRNAMIRIDSCYIGDQRTTDSADDPYIEMSDNTKLIITNSQIGSDSIHGQPFIKCGSGCQVRIENSNLTMTNQAEPGADRFLNYGGVPFSGEIGCDFMLDNVTWNVIPQRVNRNHNVIPFECRTDKWRPKSNTPIKNFAINPFFIDSEQIKEAWVDVTIDSNSPFYGHYNPYGGHIYSMGNTQQSFDFEYCIPEEYVGRTFYLCLYVNAQLGAFTPYVDSSTFQNISNVDSQLMTGANNFVAPNSLCDHNIFTPVMNVVSFTADAATGKIGINRNGAETYISGIAIVLDEDINKFPIYDNLF